MAGLHSDDPVSARGLLHAGGLHPDDGVGEGETPQLPEGVSGLSLAALAHPALRPVGQASFNLFSLLYRTRSFTSAHLSELILNNKVAQIQSLILTALYRPL